MICGHLVCFLVRCLFCVHKYCYLSTWYSFLFLSHYWNPDFALDGHVSFKKYYHPLQWGIVLWHSFDSEMLAESVRENLSFWNHFFLFPLFSPSCIPRALMMPWSGELKSPALVLCWFILECLMKLCNGLFPWNI